MSSGFASSDSNARPVQQRPQRVEKEVRILCQRQDGDPLRVVGIFVHGALDAGARQRVRHRSRVAAAAIDEQLHEQALVRALGLAVLHAAAFGEIRRLRSAASVSVLCHKVSLDSRSDPDVCRFRF